MHAGEKIPVTEYWVTQPIPFELTAHNRPPIFVMSPFADKSLCEHLATPRSIRRCKMNTTKPVLINDDHGYGKTLRTRNESSYFYSWNKNVQPIIALKIPPNWCANSFSLYCLQDTQYRVYNPQVVKVNVTNKRGTLELKDIQKEEKPSGSSVIIRGVDMVKYQLGRCWEGEIAIHLMWGIRAGVHAISEVELYGEYTGTYCRCTHTNSYTHADTQPHEHTDTQT